MKLSALAVLLLGTFACGGSAAPPVAKAPAPAQPAAGATMAQPADDTKRPMTASECDTLGQWIAEGCHGGGSRSARVEGWCSDVVARVTSGSWTDACVQHVHRVDTVCFLGSDSPSTMMACDSSVEW